MTDALHGTDLSKQIANELQISDRSIKNVISLLDDGNTVPFIARYRKELTGGLDEVQILAVSDRLDYVKNLNERKTEVIRLITEQEKLTDELRAAIMKSTKLQEVEDLYRPYKQKRRTKATMAKEKGLEGLAEWLISQPRGGDPLQQAEQFISEEKAVQSALDALQGAKDIIAEWISDDAEVRKQIRAIAFKDGKVSSKSKDAASDEKGVYENYYDYEEPIQRIVPHRVLALNRGEKDGVLRISLVFPVEKMVKVIERKHIKEMGSPVVLYLQEAIEDGYKRLLEPAVEREVRNDLTDKAEEQAIHIFSENLRNLLLQPPIRDKVVLAVDPAYRTGCKLAVVDETGKVLAINVIYPTPPRNEIAKAKEVVETLIRKYDIDVIAIGNGTASRESEQFIADTIRDIEKDVFYLIVNEAGASVYSASETGREEFPGLPVEERSAISIARRLQDPLAELVKIDPKSVGVGQYQHDVSQKRLNGSLTFVVETVVNRVGVNVNTASSSLLQYVSGLSKAVANNIVKKREEEGKFTNRNQLKSVPRLGNKTYVQAIGFIRIPDGNNPLDQTGIHPESYPETMQLLESIGASVSDIGTKLLKEKLDDLNSRELSQQLDIGEPTIRDIMDALVRPGRDPRDDLSKPVLKMDVLKLEDLEKGMELQGTVRNVVDFGAFIDIGLKQDGLVHISKLTNRFVKHPMEVAAVGDVVTVWVEDIDEKKGRVALTMLAPENQI